MSSRKPLLIIRLEWFTKCFSKSCLSEAMSNFLGHLGIVFHRRSIRFQAQNGTTVSEASFPLISYVTVFLGMESAFRN